MWATCAALANGRHSITFVPKTSFGVGFWLDAVLELGARASIARTVDGARGRAQQRRHDVRLVGQACARGVGTISG